jgi:hypothetical protein
MIMKALSRTPIDQKRNQWIPYFTHARLKKSPADSDVRESFIQAQHLSLVLASLIHASFFIMMGLTKGYVTILAAYVVAAFARAILCGELFNIVLVE